MLDPLPVLPPNQRADLGEGVGIAFMKRILCNRGDGFPPPFPFFEMGEVPKAEGGA